MLLRFRPPPKVTRRHCEKSGCRSVRAKGIHHDLGRDSFRLNAVPIVTIECRGGLVLA
jgi:hypothetical protein